MLAAARPELVGRSRGVWRGGRRFALMVGTRIPIRNSREQRGRQRYFSLTQTGDQLFFVSLNYGARSIQNGLPLRCESKGIHPSVFAAACAANPSHFGETIGNGDDGGPIDPRRIGQSHLAQAWIQPDQQQHAILSGRKSDVLEHCRESLKQAGVGFADLIAHARRQDAVVDDVDTLSRTRLGEAGGGVRRGFGSGRSRR